MYENYLEHHGVKGQKWGVIRQKLNQSRKRRYKKEIEKLKQREIRDQYETKHVAAKRAKDDYFDARLDRYETRKERRERRTAEKRSRRMRKLLSVAAGVYAYRHRDSISSVISKVMGMKTDALKAEVVEKGAAAAKSAAKKAAGEKVAEATVDRGARTVGSVLKKVGGTAFTTVKNGAASGAKKATNAVATGAIMFATKRAMDNLVGKETSAVIFQANDSKKISKFWKTSPDDKDDREDD